MTSVNNLNIFTFIKDIYQSLKHIDKTSTLSNETLTKRITKLEENQQILIDKCTTIELLLNKLGETNTTHHNLDKTLEFELLEKMKKLNQNELNNEKLFLKPEELTFANVIENNYNFTDINESIGYTLHTLDTSLVTLEDSIETIENKHNSTTNETLDSLLF
jgi:hypothetical protein